MSMLDDAGAARLDLTERQTDGERAGWPVDPYRLQRALLRHKWWLIGAGAGAVVVAFLVVKLLMISNYESMVVLKYEGEPRIGELQSSGYGLGPATEALMHQSVLRKIREVAGFEGTLTELGSLIQYELDLQSGTLRFTVPGETGEEAAKFARIVTDVFMAYHKERQFRRIEDEIARMAKRIEAAESNAEQARQRYNEFREEHGIANLSTEQESTVELAAQFRADSELAVLEIGVLEAQVKSLETQLASTPKTSFVLDGSSPERATYNRLRGELVSARATLSADHPQVQALEQQVDQLRSQLQSGGGASSRGEGQVGANSTYQALEGQLRDAKSRVAAFRERQKGLTRMADKAQRRVEGFSGIEGEASALLAAVKVNEGLLSGLRGTETVLEDALRAPPNGFTVLDPGEVPEYPVRNKKKIAVFAAIPMICVALVLLLVLLSEFRGLKLETPAEVAFWGNGPVLSATSWPNDLRGLDELVAGLDDVVPSANGDLLIIGASPAESGLARELAARLNHDWFLDEGSGATREMPDIGPYERAPLQTPPPSGPYPVGGKGAGTGSVALLRQPPERMRLARAADQLQLQAWDGPHEGQALRRAARLANRVLVLVRSGAISALRLYEIQNRLGRKYGIGFIVVGLPDELRSLPDRAGDVAGFWGP